MMRASLLAATLACGLATSSATAQAGRDTIAGPWKFATEEFGYGCTMTGNVAFKPGASPGAFTCSMTIDSTCRENGEVWQTWRVVESCTATKTGAQVVSLAKIDRIESATYLGKEATPARKARYTNDNLALTITKSGVEMKGVIVDGSAPIGVRLWRDVDLVG